MSTDPSQMPAMVPGLRPGDKLMHFQVQQGLASGGMGILWRGQDHLLGRAVAIKQIASAATVDEAFRERFRREADLCKRVGQTSPYLVAVLDCVDDPRGLFVVMEFVEGTSLDRLLAQTDGPLDPLRALTIIRDVAQGLAVLHAAGLVHRDLKPGNILLPPAGPAKICDFGLATLWAQQEALQMGTAQYMAPELFSGAPADPCSDLYGLGMVAYEMLVGRPAFAETFKAVLRDQRNTAMRWMKWHTNLRITAPTLYPADPRVPPVLSELVQRMMAKDPVHRVRSAAELLDVIQNHFSKTSAPQRSPAAAPGSAAALSTGAVGVAGGAAASFDPPTRAVPKRSAKVPVLVGLVVLQGLALGAYLYYQHSQGQAVVQKQQQDAEDAFQSARSLYTDAESGRFASPERIQRLEQARDAFEKLSTRWVGHERLGLGAKAYAAVCQGCLDLTGAESAMLEGRYPDAANLMTKSAAALAAADELELPPQATELRDTLGKLRREVAQSQAFVDVAQKIEASIGAGQFEEARRHYRDLSQASVALTASEQNRLADLGVRIQDQDGLQKISQVRSKVRGLIAQGKLPAAQQELEKALTRYGAGQPELKKDLLEVQREIRYAAALIEAQEAESNNQLPQAISRLNEAAALKPDVKLTQRVTGLRAGLAYQDGMRLFDSGDPKGAAGRFTDALSFDRQHAQAKQMLQRIGVTDEKDLFLTRASTAAAAGEFEQAVNLYKQALALEADDPTQEKLKQAMVRNHVKIATGHARAGDLTGAQEELDKAQLLDLQDAQALALQKNLKTLSQFNGLVAEADRLRAQSRFGPAKSKYQEAITLAKSAGLDASDIEALQRETDFDHLLAQARSAMESLQWEKARAFLLTARKNIRSTPQLEELLAEVEKHVDPEKK